MVSTPITRRCLIVAAAAATAIGLAAVPLSAAPGGKPASDPNTGSSSSTSTVDTTSAIVRLAGDPLSVNPRTKPATVKIDRDRVQHWIKLGARPSDTVRTLLARHMPVVAAAEAEHEDGPRNHQGISDEKHERRVAGEFEPLMTSALPRENTA